jgi:inorganic pyrophosphatase/exopolyphosphatase
MQNKTYVIGHVNPDTDSIASAMGYAWLLRARAENGCRTSRAQPAPAWYRN